MSQITVNRFGLLPLSLVVDQNGGVAGLACSVSLRDTSTGQYLDFSDLTFKAAGHATPWLVLADLGFGAYGASLDLGTLTNLPGSTTHLEALYRSQGTVTGTDLDLVTLESNLLDDEEADAGITVRRALKEVRSGIAGKINRAGNVYAYRDTLDSQDLFRLEDNDTTRDPV